MTSFLLALAVYASDLPPASQTSCQTQEEIVILQQRLMSELVVAARLRQVSESLPPEAERAPAPVETVNKIDGAVVEVEASGDTASSEDVVR